MTNQTLENILKWYLIIFFFTPVALNLVVWMIDEIKSYKSRIE